MNSCAVIGSRVYQAARDTHTRGQEDTRAHTCDFQVRSPVMLDLMAEPVDHIALMAAGTSCCGGTARWTGTETQISNRAGIGSAAAVGDRFAGGLGAWHRSR